MKAFKDDVCIRFGMAKLLSQTICRLRDLAAFMKDRGVSATTNLENGRLFFQIPGARSLFDEERQLPGVVKTQEELIVHLLRAIEGEKIFSGIEVVTPRAGSGYAANATLEVRSGVKQGDNITFVANAVKILKEHGASVQKVKQL